MKSRNNFIITTPASALLLAPAAFAGNEWRINYNDLTGGSNFTSAQAGATGFVRLTVIPEPSSLALGLGGLGALMLRRRRTLENCR